MELTKTIVLALVTIVLISGHCTVASEVDQPQSDEPQQTQAAPVNVNVHNLKTRTGRFYPYYGGGGGYGGSMASAQASASANSFGGGYGGHFG